MLPKDFGHEFGEEKDMSADTHEKAPGVYVRAENELPQELDMLWSNSRTYHREERSPLISFIAGLLIGAILTTAVFFLFVMRPKVETNSSEITAPITDGVNTGATAPGTPSNVTGQPAASTAAIPSNATSYTVKSGDTLGSIAEKVYGSSAPKYQEKIQRANNMDNPNSLQLDQKLVIPPKDY